MPDEQLDIDFGDPELNDPQYEEKQESEVNSRWHDYATDP